jgi:uncharacterized iron-regulated membrane protein
MTLRQILLRLHLIVGCVAAPFLFVAGISGTIVVFENPYADHVANARLTHVTAGAALLPLDAIRDSLRQTFADADVADVSFPIEGRNTYVVGLVLPSDSNRKVVYVDPWRGTVVGDGEDARSPLRWAHDLHTRLMSGQPGRLLVAWIAVALVFLSLTGLWLWWPGKVLTVRRHSSPERKNFELHSMLGGLSWLFMLAFGLTGMIVHWEDGAQKLLLAVTGGTKPAAAPKPNGVCAARPLASLDLIVQHIDAAAPGAYATIIQFGNKATDAVLARMRYPEDKTPAGRTHVIAERCTGNVIYALSTRDAPLAWRWTRMWNRSVHTGDVWGWPTRIFAALLSLLLPVMALTGPAIWWTRRTRRLNR